ncbi:MAG: HD domain-containing protein [archaeon]
MITLKDVQNNVKVKEFIKKADDYLEKIGYTEHGSRHTKLVSDICKNILLKLGYSKREVELASIAGYLHDIGNVLSRKDHAQSGAMLAYNILNEMGMDVKESLEIMTAIANHEEDEKGVAVSVITAVLMIADKSDVHKTRVRNRNTASFDIHDRVNYAVTKSFVYAEDKNIRLELTIDTKFSPIMEYFEIFLERMMSMKKASAFLGCDFSLIINGTKII